MGVTNLWQILLPVKQHQTLSSLKGQTLAVDLSIWVCENQCIKQMQGVVTKPHLRNLYFRVSYMLHLGINLIFAIEGEAPDLKHETMSRRQDVQYKGKSKGPPRQRKRGRSQFNAKLRECCEMLDYLGVPYIQSKGEAEALCGLLNVSGIVDGCITNDGDVFLYGAKTVYRNFTINSKDPHVETYNMCDIEEKLDLDREKMVALALLVGCDYVPKGVPGVGIDKASKLLTSYKDISPLQRFKNWRSMSDCDCYDSIEVQIKRKAAVVTEFPQIKVIEEFLISKDPVPTRTLKWGRPMLVQLQIFSLKKLEWPEHYTQDKVLPLITLWDMTDIVKGGNHGHLTPHRIVKARVRHGIPSLEVEWYKQEDDRLCQSDYYATIEDRELFSQCFPQLVVEFDQQAALKKSKSKGRKKKTKEITDDIPDKVNEQQEDVDILTEQLNNLHVEPQETGDIIHKPNEKCTISTLSDKKLCTSESENSSVCQKRDEIDSNNESFDDTNEFEISYAEDNMSLRSRLLKKTSTNCQKTSNLCNMVEAEFVDSDSENETYFQPHSEIIFEKPNKNHYNLPQSPARTLEHKLQNNNFYTPNTNIKNKDKEFLNLNEQTPDQETKTDDIQSLPDFEETSVKIYSVSDFSHTGNLNDEINTPNVSRMKNWSPSLYQTFLESTPTTTSKLQKAALLNSILRSPLQVDAILNMMRKRHEVVSPVVSAVNEAKSLDKSVNNLSSVSLNGTISAFGNFQIESSLLKSIISSGGSISDSPDVGKCQNITNQNRKSVDIVTKVDVETSVEDNIVSKLSFDVNSPLIPLQEKCTSQMKTVKPCGNSSKFSTSHLKRVKPCGNSSKSSTSSIILKKEDCPVIDLTCDTPERHDCRTTLDLSCHDDSSINKVRNKPGSNFFVDTDVTYHTPDRKTGTRTKFSDKSTLDLSVDINDKELLSETEIQPIRNCHIPEVDITSICSSTSKNKKEYNVNIETINTNQTSVDHSPKLRKSCVDGTGSSVCGFTRSSDCGFSTTTWSKVTDNLAFVSGTSDETRNFTGVTDLNIGQMSIDTTSPFIDRTSPSIRGLCSPTWTKGVTDFNIRQTNMDTTSPFIDRNSPSIQGLCSPTWNKGKENETIVSASQDMLYTNKKSVVLDVTFDENSPVSLADRLRRKLNISTMRGVLQEVAGNKTLQK